MGRSTPENEKPLVACQTRSPRMERDERSRPLPWCHPNRDPAENKNRVRDDTKREASLTLAQAREVESRALQLSMLSAAITGALSVRA